MAASNASAATLTGEGHRSPNCQNMVLPITVGQIRRGAGIRVTEPRTGSPMRQACSARRSSPSG